MPGRSPVWRPVVEHDAAVDDDGGDADRILERIGERRAIGDRRRIEDHEVGRQPVLDQPAIGDVQLRRGQAAHLVDRLFERDDVFLAHVLAEHARERAEVARMRHAVAQRPAGRQRRAVRSDRDPRLLHRQLQIVFVDDEPDAADVAALRDQDLEDEVVRILARRLRRIVDAHAFVLLVGDALREIDASCTLCHVPAEISRFSHVGCGSSISLRILRARRRILQPLGQLRAAAFVRPRRNRLREAGAAGDVRDTDRRRTRRRASAPPRPARSLPSSGRSSSRRSP